MKQGKFLFTIKEIQEPIYDAFEEFTGNYKRGYENFKNLKELQDRKNPGGLWEIDSQDMKLGIFSPLNTKETPQSLMFNATASAYYFPQIDVYEYGRNGFEFIAHHQPVSVGESPFTTTMKALPACHEGFHRNWNQDGICVRDSSD